MNDYQPFDREAIGRRIKTVRKQAKLSQVEFSKKLKTPVMITEIAEHGIKADSDAAITFNLSANALVRLLKMISDKFNVSFDWLMYGYDTPGQWEDISPSSNEEITLFLPMTISDRSLASEMNDALIMMSSSRRYETERYDLQKAMLESIVEKYRLYRQYTDSSGGSEHASLACKQMLEVLNHHKSRYIM